VVKKRGDEPLERPGRWLLLAQEEVARRLATTDAELLDSSLDRELEMQARLKARYPDMPLNLVLKFSRRLAAGSFSWEAWDDAVAWLETTKWHERRSP
jgi:hypothetical protein